MLIDYEKVFGKEVFSSDNILGSVDQVSVVWVRGEERMRGVV